MLAAGREAGIDFALNARTDALLRAGADTPREEVLAEAIRRGRAFLDAGAPVVLLPGLVARDEIAQAVDALVGGGSP